MSSNSVCNHTRDKQIGLPLRGRPILYHSYDYRPNWTPLSPITITNEDACITACYYMANPVLGKSLCSDWFFLGQDFANPCIFVLDRSRQIQHLQPRQPKKSVKIVILHIETTSRS